MYKQGTINSEYAYTYAEFKDGTSMPLYNSPADTSGEFIFNIQPALVVECQKAFVTKRDTTLADDEGTIVPEGGTIKVGQRFHKNAVIKSYETLDSVKRAKLETESLNQELIKAQTKKIQF